MRKIFLLSLFILVSFFAISQKLQYVNTYGYEYPRFTTSLLQGLPKDTITVPSSLDTIPWLANKDGIIYRWDTAYRQWIAVISSSQAANCNDLINPINIVYMGTGFDWIVAGGGYYINCTPYPAVFDTLTNEDADTVYDRYDAFYVDATGVHIRAGEPDALPIIPSMESGEILVGWVRIPANDSVPELSQIFVYNENIEGWTVTQTGTTINADATNNPWFGAKSIEVTNMNDNDRLLFKRGAGPVDLTNVTSFVFGVDLKQVIPSTGELRLTFFNNGVQVSDEKIIPLNKKLTVFQPVSMPKFQFNLRNYNVDSIRFRYTNAAGSSLIHQGFWLDYIHFVTGVTQVGGGGGVNSVVVNDLGTSVRFDENPGIGDVVINPVALGTSNQWVDGTFSLRTKDWVTKIGAVDNYPKVANGLRISGDTLYGQTADASNYGGLSALDWRRFDSAAQRTVQYDGDGYTLLVDDPPYNTLIKSIKFSNEWKNTDSTIVLDTTTSGGGSGGNLKVERGGAGIQSWWLRTADTTLMLKDVIGETFTTVDTKTDSTLRVRLDTASAGLKSYIALYGGGSIPTLQQVLTAGSTLTTNATIDADGNSVFLTDAGLFNVGIRTATSSSLLLDDLVSQLNSPDGVSYLSAVNNTGIDIRQSTKNHFIMRADSFAFKTTNANLDIRTRNLPLKSSLVSTDSLMGKDVNGKWFTVKPSDLGISGGGGGDVTKVGTPSNHQFGIWTGDGTIKGVSVTGSRAMATDADGEPVASSTTATELGYVNGVTSAIQTQLNNKAPLVSPTITILTSGTTWTTPSDITSTTVFKITMVGGGGGGGGSNGTNIKSGCGGAGGALVKYVSGLTASTGYTYAIGAAGAAGTDAPTSGGAGGNTTLTIGATTYTANGGGGGIVHTSTGAGGAGGTATDGDINITGQSGDAAPTGASTAVLGGRGGSPAFGLGMGGAVVVNPSDGAPGTGYGAGGSGAMGVTNAGGAGTQGVIMIERMN